MAPGQKLNNFVLRCKMGMARRVIGRKSAKVFAKLFVGDEGVELLHKLYEVCRLLIGGDQKEANRFIDRSIRIMTDCIMLALERKFTEFEQISFVNRCNDAITLYNRLFDVIEKIKPGFNDEEIPIVESTHQIAFKEISQTFIIELTKIFIETLGHHCDPSLIRCVHTISNQLCSKYTLNQMCYTKSPTSLLFEEVTEAAQRLELTQPRLHSVFKAIGSDSTS